MASYSASMIVMGITGKPMRGGGSFANINIDGRLSLDAAITVARETFKKECNFNKQDYLGFAIEKTARFVDYKSPNMIDTTLKAKDVAFLL
uniref:Uncharacterized protein n=1 Tax=Escherichia phage BME3 TaxID=3119681 RepID=A0AAU6NVQ7_9CAUD